MNPPKISIEGLSKELVEAYICSGMERGKAGEKAISWAFDGNEKAFAVARTEAGIVGVSAYIRTRMKLGELVGCGYQAVDSFVSERMRGAGVFSALARAYDGAIRSDAGDLVWGFPNDNAAPAWFSKLDWQSFGQVPFLIKPLRAGFFLRKLRLPGDFPLGRTKDQGLTAIGGMSDWADTLWDCYGHGIGCATIRDAAYLQHRLFLGPHSEEYRVVAETDSARPALVATREAKKHGGHIAYLMEAMGETKSLQGILNSELARLRGRGAELALAWSYPWSPNYKTLRRCGFLPLPEKMRPIRIWFGARPHTEAAREAQDVKRWYLSYLDSDTV